MGIERARACGRAESPDVSKELVLREHLRRFRGELRRELELLAGERGRHAGDGHAPSATVDDDVSSDEKLALVAGGRPPEHRADPREQLHVDDRPVDDVVRTPLECPDPVDRVGLRFGEHDHRHLAIPLPSRLALAQPPAELQLAGQDERRPCPLDEVERLAAPLRADHVEAVVPEVPLEVRPRVELGLGENEGASHRDRG